MCRHRIAADHSGTGRGQCLHGLIEAFSRIAEIGHHSHAFVCCLGIAFKLFGHQFCRGIQRFFNG